LFIRIRFLVISPNERKNRIRKEREKDEPMQEKVTFSSFNTKKSFASLAKKMDSKNKYRTNFSLLARVKSREERRRWLLPGPLAN
jgi:predicted 3-demethylubiquinone-9 3-methyltransferase (glyoxalase superfamily)